MWMLAFCLLAPCQQSDAPSDPAPKIAAGVTRPWLGPEFYANRLQDWRLHDGHIECIEMAEQRPMRTAHLLSHSLGEKVGAAEVSVEFERTDVIDSSDTTDAETAGFAGFLLGAGGSGIDARLTALVHHRPAPDGGIVIAVARDGAITFRDFEHNVEPGGWGITGKLDPGELFEIAPTTRSHVAPIRPTGRHRLTVSISPQGPAYRLTAVVTTVADSHAPASEIARATLDDVAPALVEGNIALCSHRATHRFANITLAGDKVVGHPGRHFGPIVTTMYTRPRGGDVKLTAQMTALGQGDTQSAALQVPNEVGGAWKTLATARLDPDARTFEFRIDRRQLAAEQPFRVLYELRTGPATRAAHTWTGVFRDAADDAPFTVAAFTGNKHFTGGIRWNHDGVWFPHRDIVQAVRWHDPDLLFFSGDQIYEGDLTGVQREPIEGAMLDYLDKWYRWCWAFGDLARDRPCVCIPDDHDVFHGNLWGAGGRHARRQDDGGFTMPVRFVNMVQRTQTSHLPDPFDPTPCESGIGVYYTRYRVGPVDFAILEDRKWKSSPTEVCVGGDCRNGWFQNPDYDPARQADVAGAQLLGARQLAFLEHWADADANTDGSRATSMKCVLSQTIFANVATLPAAAKSGDVLPGLAHPAPGVYPSGDRLAADADSNGWPQSGRNAALRIMRRAGALHIAGDQHLGSLIRYGIEEFDDAGHAFCVPSIANTWPRRWFPPEPGANRAPDTPPYTGQFFDGFGNRMTVLAVSNPRDGHVEPKALHDRAPGYGIVRFDPSAGAIRIECWPRHVDPSAKDARQYEGWPVTLELDR